MKGEKFPIVKIDRTTAQEMLPIFINKGIFSNYKALPTKEELLTKAKAESGVDKLSDEEQRIILGDAGMYRNNNYIVRDYGKYVVGFGLGFLKEDSEEKITDAIERISLYKLGHKLATIILAEVYDQRKFTDIVISKEKLLEYLGYSTKEKQIYKQIDDVMFSLMTLNYFIYEYRTELFAKMKSRELGYFIYNVKSDYKNYTLSVNENYIGCIKDVMDNEKEKERDFSRGYFSYPTSLIPASKDYSTAAYLLSTFLISDSGNAKLNYNKVKVVAYSVEYLLDVMKIEKTRVSDIKKAFLQAVNEVKIINNTTPSLKDLSAMNPSRLIKQTVYFYLPSEIRKLDSSIKSNLLGVK